MRNIILLPLDIVFVALHAAGRLMFRSFNLLVQLISKEG
jgi:hypothetical protein